MKCVTLNELETDLDRNPEDWSLRLKLVEGYILEDDIDSARRLVRESPDDAPLPRELQFRLHTVMTQGAAAVERFYADENGGQLPFLQEVTPAADRALESSPQDASKDGLKSDGAAVELAGVSDTEAEERTDSQELRGTSKQENKEQAEIERETEAKEKQKETKGAKVVPAKKSAEDDLESDLDSDLESKSKSESKSKRRSKKRSKAALDPVTLSRPKQKKWMAPAGFEFGDDESAGIAEEKLAALHQRRPQAGLKLSAFTLALMFHIVMVVAFAFVAVSMRPKDPPKIVAVSVMAEREPVIAPRLVKKDTPKAASASAQPAPLISTTSASNYVVPEFDMKATPDVTSLVAGVDIGHGMSFHGAGEESNVNFFGIQSGGKRIAFIIDATRYMLVDEKGGMFAYDKVKAEVAAMLSQLKRGTAFNIILYEGKTLSLFREQPESAKPSSVRLATEWLDSLNRNYASLGLRGRVATTGRVKEGLGSVEARDNSGYMKAIQLALEMDVNAVFAISSGYRRISRSLSPEQVAEVRNMNAGRTGGTVDPKARAAWNQAVAKTREWLRNENAARAEKGLAPKVVINFNALVRQVTGATPPRATGGSPAPAGMPRPGPPYTQDELEDHLKEVVVQLYHENNKAVPEIHMVLFLGEDQDLGDDKDHFRRLTKKNKGKLKILKGLAALQDVTGE